MIATASEPIHLGTRPIAPSQAAVRDAGVRTIDGIVSRAAAEDIRRSTAGRIWSALADGVLCLGVICMIPAAVLVIGTPVALAIVFLLWLVRLAF